MRKPTFENTSSFHFENFQLISKEINKPIGMGLYQGFDSLTKIKELQIHW
jgi:hypothetical protein